MSAKDLTNQAHQSLPTSLTDAERRAFADRATEHDAYRTIASQSMFEAFVYVCHKARLDHINRLNMSMFSPIPFGHGTRHG